MAAPSFSSFPPSFSSFPEFDEGNSKPSDGLLLSKREEIKKRGKPKKDKEIKVWKQKRESRKYVEESYKTENLRNSSPAHEYREDMDLGSILNKDRAEASLLFYSDRKGDPLNVHYGGLHAGDVPKHHLVSRGRKILGLDDSWTAVQRSGKGVEVFIGTGRKMPHLTDPKSRALLASAPKRKLVKAADPFKYEEGDGFIRLPSRRPRLDDQDYRSITKRTADSDSASSNSDVDQPSTDDDSDAIPLTSYQETTKSLDQKLTANPSSISTWLLLLSHSLSTIPLTSKNATRARSEITVAIMSRALSAHPDNAASKILRLKYLMAGEEIWHESKLRAEWENAWKIGGAEIWMEWLEWRIRIKNRGMNGIVEDAVRVLQAFGDDEPGKIRVFWRMAMAFQTAGYTERATALFQAQMELVFNVPPALASSPIEDQLEALEKFWDSEVPLVGQPDAKGWASWSESSEKYLGPTQSSHVIQTAEEQQLASDPYVQWSMQEASADRTLRTLMRSVNEAEESDPFGTVLFDDIQPLLLSIRTAHAKHALRLAWLSLLGLHIPGFSESLSPDRWANADDRWCHTYLTSPHYFSVLLPADATHSRITTDAYAGVVIGREKEYASGFGPVKNWGYGVMSPLEGVDESRLWNRENLGGVDEALVRRVFIQLRQRDDPDWDVLHLAFEAAMNIKSALNISKTLLSTARDSFTHWAAHARLERLRGRTQDARKVYQTVLVSSAYPRTGSGISRLWWDWAETEWLAGSTDAAVDVIVQSAGVDATGDIRILRARRNLEEAVTPESQWEDREAWIKLLALLECLTISIDAALAAFDLHLSNLENGSIAHESLLVSSLLMIYRQRTVLKNAIPPATLRLRAEKSLETYPSNTIVLGMFLEAEKGQGIWGRVRQLLGEGADREKDVSRRVMEVWIPGWEKGRWFGERERIRNGLSFAVESERTRSSAILWRIYLEFEIRVGDKQQAKKLLYRAIGECPLAKELYLLAFGPLRSVFSAAELDAFSDTMAEREIRMRKGLDEFLKDHEEHEEDDDSESEDEMEHDANELARLRPY